MRNKEILILILVIIFGFALRLISINQSFWLDEATTANVVNNFTFLDIINKFIPNDFHPPLYYFFEKCWAYLFGSGEVVLRIPSVLFSLGTIWICYLIAKFLAGEKVALASSVLMATSSLGIYYSQEARMYMMACFLVALAIYFYLRASRGGKYKTWIMFSLFILLIGATDYMALLIIPLFLVDSLLILKNRNIVKNVLISLLPLFLFFLLWSPIFLKQFVSGTSVRDNMPNWWGILGGLDLKQLALIPLKFITGRVTIENKLFYVPLVFIYIFPSFYIAIKSKFKNNYLFFLLWFLLPVIVAIVLSLKIPVLLYFRFIFILPAFYILISYPLKYQKNVLANIYLIILVVLNLYFSCSYLLNVKNQREDWRAMVSFVEKESLGKKCEVLFVADSQMEAYNYYSSGSVKAVSPQAYDDKKDCIWLMRYVREIFDPEDSVRKKVEDSSFKLSDVYDFNGVVVARYDR